MQVDSKSIVGGYHYIRSGPPVPALLHTCRESRYEYIEVEDPEDESQKTLPRRRSAHPVYKLCFAGTGRSTRKAKKGVYMELNWDTLWATPTLNSPMAGLQHRFSGLMFISRSRFADRLTSLTLSPYTILDKELQLLLSRFTALKTLTMLVTKDLLRLNGYETSKVVIPAENNNQLDLQALINHHIIGPGTYSLVNWQNHQIQIFQAYSSAHPGQTMPELLWRFEEQLLEKEGFTFPALEEEDPLKYMELEMAETDRLRQASKRQAERESMVEGSSKKRKAMLRPM